MRDPDPWHQRGYLIHCLPGWRAPFCALINVVPAREVYDEEDDYYYVEPRFGFGWAFKLHDWAADTIKFDEEEDVAEP